MNRYLKLSLLCGAQGAHRSSIYGDHIRACGWNARNRFANTQMGMSAASCRAKSLSTASKRSRIDSMSSYIG